MKTHWISEVDITHHERRFTRTHGWHTYTKRQANRQTRRNTRAMIDDELNGMDQNIGLDRSDITVRYGHNPMLFAFALAYFLDDTTDLECILPLIAEERKYDDDWGYYEGSEWLVNDATGGRLIIMADYYGDPSIDASVWDWARNKFK